MKRIEVTRHSDLKEVREVSYQKFLTDTRPPNKRTNPDLDALIECVFKRGYNSAMTDVLDDKHPNIINDVISDRVEKDGHIWVGGIRLEPGKPMIIPSDWDVNEG
jgi:hypothetical protein